MVESTHPRVSACGILTAKTLIDGGRETHSLPIINVLSNTARIAEGTKIAWAFPLDPADEILPSFDSDRRPDSVLFPGKGEGEEGRGEESKGKSTNMECWAGMENLFGSCPCRPCSAAWTTKTGDKPGGHIHTQAKFLQIAEHSRADSPLVPPHLANRARKIKCPECHLPHYPNCLSQRLQAQKLNPDTPTEQLPKFINHIAIDDEHLEENNQPPKCMGTDPNLARPSYPGAEPPEFADYQIKEPSLTRKQKFQLLKVLKANMKVFAVDDYDLGTYNGGQFHLGTGNHQPIHCNPHAMPHHLKPVLRRALDDMLERGYIEPSSSNWAAPIVYAKKPNGGWRLCVDFRKLNQIADLCVYPLPRIQDIFASLEGARYFSSIDLTKGFWQIELDE